MATSHDPFTISRIDESIYLGPAPCCREHFLSEVIGNGIDTVVSLEGENSEAPRGSFVFLWLPVLDNFPPAPEQLRIGIRTIDELIRAGRKVFVHCRYGMGRGPTMVAAHFVKHGMSAEEAVAYVKKCHPKTQLNTLQFACLEEYQRHVQDKTAGRMHPHRVYPKTMEQRVKDWKKTFS